MNFMTLETPIRILSDLHLAHPASRIDDVEKLQPLIDGAKTVIFNGDTFEQQNASLREAGAEMFADLKQLCAECGAAPVFLSGNHDPQVSGPDFLDLADGKIFVTHGDALFPTISPWNPKTWPLAAEMRTIHAKNTNRDLAAKVVATARCRAMINAVDRPFPKNRFWKLSAAFRLIWPPKRPFEIARCWLETPRRAADFTNTYRPESRVFIFGHTHRPFVKERGERIFINTGGFLSVGKAQLVEVVDGEISVYEIEESESGFTKGVGKLLKKL